jgi:hypothetical protein
MTSQSTLIRRSDGKKFKVVDLAHWSTIAAEDGEQDRVKWYGDGYVSANKGASYFVLGAFEIPRHNDVTYDPPEPWTAWDGYAGCWTCRVCGAAAGYQLHSTSCRLFDGTPVAPFVLPKKSPCP